MLYVKQYLLLFPARWRLCEAIVLFCAYNFIQEDFQKSINNDNKLDDIFRSRYHSEHAKHYSINYMMGQTFEKYNLMQIG